MHDANSSSPAMPQPEQGGLVRTLNRMGYMTSALDVYSQAFVEFAAAAPGAALEIGAAYGVATLEALKRGAQITANDLDPRHLDILTARVPAAWRGNLRTQAGAFPDALTFPDGSFGAVLVCRVMHFFDGPTLERAARRLFNWLMEGGKVFVVAETPYIRNFREIIPQYEARRLAGDPWPGYFANVHKITPHRAATLPACMHLLDVDVLSRVFTAEGFHIERAATFGRPDFPDDLRLDGRESVGLIAVKPRG